MRKRVSVLLTVILLLSMLPMSTFATDLNAAKITVDSADATAGDTISVNVYLANNPGIVSANINVAFDEGLTLVGASNGKVFPASISFIPPRQLSTGGKITGNCNFAWQGADIEDEDIKDGIILTLRFKVSEKAASGDVYGITVTARNSDIVDKDLQCVKLDASHGKIKISTNQQNPNNENVLGNFIKKFIKFVNSFLIKIKQLFSNVKIIKTGGLYV